MRSFFFVYAALCISLFGSCQNATSNSAGEIETEEDAEKPESQKKVSKRDYSITKANSYSNLFMDSMAMEKFISDKKLSDSLSRRMRSFYNARNYQFAWFSSDGLTEQALTFWNLHDYVTTYDDDTSLRDKALQKRMDYLVAEEKLSVGASDKSFLNTELTLTEHFITYVLTNYEKGYVKRKEMERFIPFKKQDPLFLADSIINKKHKDDKYFENVNKSYALLKDNLIKYYEITKKGGWPAIATTKKTLKKGMTDPLIPAIKRRLMITGEMKGSDTSSVFTDTLEQAVKTYQSRFGYKPDGTITASLIKDMNVPAEKRMEQIMMNMGRMRWMPEPKDGQLILVNIPEYKLHVYEGNKRAFEMVVVVGKQGHNTMMFSGDLNHVVFSPYWNVPPSIVKKEILPAINRNPGYLSAQNMEQTGSEGGLPVIRQRPGGNNALGKVKFLFPNSFNIYFHDTPSKSLFERDKRAFSHGCIRLAEPEKMANYLLRDHSEWSASRINEAMNSGTEKYVRLKKPVPVIITYYTAWVDDNGLLNFRDDIYSHDDKLATKMFR